MKTGREIEVPKKHKQMFMTKDPKENERERIMRRKTTIILTALIMACSVTACQGAAASISNSVSGDSETSGAGTQESTVSADTEEADETRTLSETEEQKLYNTYIDINNFMVDRITDSLERYFYYVDIEQEEFTLLDPDDDYFSCYSIADSYIGDIEDAYELVNDKGDKSKLDETFLEMYPSINAVISTLNEIETYTDMKSYLDDDYEKAKEYHAELMSVLEEYINTGDAFMTELDAVARERREESYAQMKEEGFEVAYTMNKAIDLANEIAEELYNQEVWDDNILDMDLEKIQPLYDEFVGYVDDLLAFDEDEEKLNAEGLYKNTGYWSWFIRDMKNTKVSLTEVLQKVENGEELSQTDQMMGNIAGNCSLSSFATGLSAVIDDYNRMVSY